MDAFHIELTGCVLLQPFSFTAVNVVVSEDYLNVPWFADDISNPAVNFDNDSLGGSCFRHDGQIVSGTVPKVNANAHRIKLLRYFSLRSSMGYGLFVFQLADLTFVDAHIVP